MSNNTIDALVYTGIQNNLTNGQLNSSGLSTKIVPTDPSQTGQFLNGILNQTTIKRACCNNLNRPGVTTDNFPVTVRIPIPANYDFGSNPLADTWKKFGYIDKTITVPKSMCGNVGGTFDYNSNQCQDFMALYCNNVKAFYKDEVATLGGKYSDDEFANYKPECACYGDQPPYLTGALPAVCFAPGCDPNNNQVFQDTNSRKNCTVTICQSNFNASGLSAGGSANINSKVNQQCGNQINKPGTPGQSGTPVTSDQTQPTGNTGTVQSPPSSPASSSPSSETPSSTSPASPSSPTAPSSPSTKPSSETPNSESGIQAYFTKDKNYLGWIFVACCIILLMCSSCFLLFRK